MTDKAGLIARLTEETGPSRELDHDIAVAAFPGAYGFATSEHNRKNGHPVGLGAEARPCMTADAPRYTESIDAALTLVPDEWRPEHIGEQLSGGRWDVELHWRDYSMDDCIQAVGRTPAIALCIATLRARQGAGE